MKNSSYILILFFLTCIFHNNMSTSNVVQNHEARFSPAAVIYQLFEMMRGLIKFGDDAKAIPVLDPYLFNAKEMNFFGLIYGGQVNISNGVLKGVGDFRLEDLEFLKNKRALIVNITVPILTLQADYYDLQGSILELLPLQGTGIMYIEIKELVIYSKIYLKQSTDGKSVLVNKLEETHYTITKILSRTEFDKNIDHILNSWIEDLLADYLTRFSKYLSSTYGTYFMDSLNPILNEYETWNILATIL